MEFILLSAPSGSPSFNKTTRPRHPEHSVWKSAKLQATSRDTQTRLCASVQRYTSCQLTQRDVNKVQAISLHLVRKSVSGLEARRQGFWLAQGDVRHVKAAPYTENSCSYWLYCLVFDQDGDDFRWNLWKLQNIRKLHRTAWPVSDSWKVAPRQFITSNLHCWLKKWNFYNVCCTGHEGALIHFMSLISKSLSEEDRGSTETGVKVSV